MGSEKVRVREGEGGGVGVGGMGGVEDWRGGWEGGGGGGGGGGRLLIGRARCQSATPLQTDGHSMNMDESSEKGDAATGKTPPFKPVRARTMRGVFL